MDTTKMNSLSYSISPIDQSILEPVVIIYQDEPSSCSTVCMYPEELNSPKCCFNDIVVNIDEDSLDGKGLHTILDSTSTRVEWLSAGKEREIQVNGSVVIVPPNVETETVQKVDETMAKYKHAINLTKQNSDPVKNHLCKSSLTCTTEKLARNGVTVTSKEFLRKNDLNFQIRSRVITSSKTYKPTLPGLIPYPLAARRMHRNNKTLDVNIGLSGSNEERIPARRQSTVRHEAKERFVCKLCDRLFKSLECFRRHDETHDINYYPTPGIWKNEGISEESYQWSGEPSFIEGPGIQEYYCDEEEFTCQVCDMIFATSIGLSKHMDVHRIPYNRKRSEERQESISEEGNAMIDLTD